VTSALSVVLVVDVHDAVETEGQAASIGHLQNCRALLIQSRARRDFYLKKHWSTAK
jgi:hypothetical protein